MPLPPEPLPANIQVLDGGRWMYAITMPHFDAKKDYEWRLGPYGDVEPEDDEWIDCEDWWEWV